MAALQPIATLAQLSSFTTHGQMSGQGVPLPDHRVVDWARLTRVSGNAVDGNEVGGQAERLDLNFANDKWHPGESPLRNARGHALTTLRHLLTHAVDGPPNAAAWR